MLGRFAWFIGYISATPVRRLGAGLFTFLVLGLLSFLVDVAMFAAEIPMHRHAAVQGAILGLGGALAVWTILLGTWYRRSAVANELARLAELNHTLRNALDVIISVNHLSRAEDERHKQMVLDAAGAVENKLRDLFPVFGAERRWAKHDHRPERRANDASH